MEACCVCKSHLAIAVHILTVNVQQYSLAQTWRHSVGSNAQIGAHVLCSVGSLVSASGNLHFGANSPLVTCVKLSWSPSNF